MFKTLKDMKDNNQPGDFLFPSVPAKVRGTVSFLSEDMVMVDSEVGDKVYQYITHPNNICIVQEKA